MKDADQTVSWQRHAQTLQILAAAVLLAYSNSFATGFSSDSAPLLLQDERVQSITRQHLEQILFGGYWATFWSGLYRPLSTLSYLFNFTILDSAGSPAGYHWVNYLLHTANAFLVYLLILQLTRRYWPAVFSALLWALHPIATEGVTYIVGRPEELAAFGVLAALVCYIRAAEESGRRKLLWLTGTMAAAAIGAFSKEGGVMVLPLAALYDLVFRRRRGAALRDLLAVALPIGVMLFVRWLVLRQESAMQIPYLDNPIVGESWLAGRITAIGVIGRYAWLLLWPAKLSADYSYHEIPAIDWAAIATVAGLLALTAFCYRRSRLAFFLLVFPALTLLPGCNLLFPTGTIMAERLLYLPAVGFAAAVVLGAYWMAHRLRLRPIAAAVPLLAIAAAYGVRTYLRNPDWKDNETLFLKAEQTVPASFKPHMMLATTWFERDPKLLNGDRAIEEAEKAQATVAGLPDRWKTSAIPWILASLYYARGETLSPKGADGIPHPDVISIEWYRKALASSLEAERIDRVQNEEFRRRELELGKPADRIPPIGPHELYANLGRIYLRLGDPQQALDSFRYERLLAPDAAESYANISTADSALEKPADAAAAMLEAYILDGSQQALYKTLELYRRADSGTCAEAREPEGATVNRQCPVVQRDFCRAYRDIEQGLIDKKRPADAQRFAEQAAHAPGCP